jgi:hypothetical protein
MGFVFFLHMHKCGGTSIASAIAAAPGHQLHEPNINGNPWVEGRSHLITFWGFPPEQYRRWIGEINRRGTTFVAAEWNFFAEPERYKVEDHSWLTCLRDPWKRFVSHYMSHGGDQRFGSPARCVAQDEIWSRPWTTQRFPIVTNKPNYFVRMLNGLGEDPRAQIGAAEAKRAESVLGLFDTVVVLELPDSFKLLSRYGATMQKERVGRTAPDSSLEEYRSEFEELNRFDTELYARAVERCQEQLAALQAVDR